MLNFHKILNGSGGHKTFHAAIEPTDSQRDYLTKARDKIRDHLDADISAASIVVLGMDKKVHPRFRTQGSWAYRTCNQTAHPTQEMDWDFGVYLPATVWEGSHPRVVAKVYFELVEHSLKRLIAKEKGWSLIPGKDTCIRVKVASWAHIDIPLYAAPKKQFDLIRERVIAKGLTLDSRINESLDFGELQEYAWQDLQEIVLATRDGTWKSSDPAAVARWFSDEVAAGTEQLRRICRYLKAWRDLQWMEGGPSSVLLMICAARDFEVRHGRDDIALEEAIFRVSHLITGPVHEPGIDGGEEDFNAKLKPHERTDAAASALKLRDAIRRARSFGSGMKPEGLKLLLAELGDRVPLLPDQVEVDGGAATVRQAPASQVAPPIVGSTQAG